MQRTTKWESVVCAEMALINSVKEDTDLLIVHLQLSTTNCKTCLLRVQHRHAHPRNAAHVLQGRTALMLACDQGHLAILRVLLAYGADYSARDKQVSMSAACQFLDAAMYRCSLMAQLCCSNCIVPLAHP